MNQVRGIFLLAIGVFALVRGWQLRFHGVMATWAWILGFVAIALGVWRLTRKPPRPLQ